MDIALPLWYNSNAGRVDKTLPALLFFNINGVQAMAKATPKLSPVQQARDKLKEARAALREMDATCMEEVWDKCGIVVERWVVPPKELGDGQTRAWCNIVLYATPLWWDVFRPVSTSNRILDTIDALKTL